MLGLWGGGGGCWGEGAYLCTGHCSGLFGLGLWPLSHQVLTRALGSGVGSSPMEFCPRTLRDQGPFEPALLAVVRSRIRASPAPGNTQAGNNILLLKILYPRDPFDNCGKGP